MLIYLFLILNIFSLSLQGIPTGFFCDDYLRGVYVVENGVSRKIENGWDGHWDIPYRYDNLNIVPGDLIRFTCYNDGGDVTNGGGCFYLYSKCHCYNFDINKPRRSEGNIRSVNFGSIECSFNLYNLQEIDQRINYDYQHYVPLDVSKVSCINSNNVIFALNGVDKTLKLSNYITSSYSIKNVETSITSSNYGYFKLNNKALVANQRYNVQVP